MSHSRKKGKIPNGNSIKSISKPITTPTNISLQKSYLLKLIQPIFIGGKKTGTELESQLASIYTNIQSQLQAAPDMFRCTIYSNHGKMALSFISKQERRRGCWQDARTTQTLLEAMVKPHVHLKISSLHVLFFTHLTPRCALKSFMPQYVSQVCVGLSNTSLRISRLNVEMQSPNLKVKSLYF